MTEETGIAATEAASPQPREDVCFVCGGAFGPRARISARIVVPHGIVQACSDVCAARPKFAGRKKRHG